MKRKRVEQAVEVINYAIKHSISVKEASVRCEYANTYVKNTKALVYDKYEKGTLDDELFTLFDDAYNEYTESRKVTKNTNRKESKDTEDISNDQVKIEGKGDDKKTIEFRGKSRPFNILGESDDTSPNVNYSNESEKKHTSDMGANYPSDHIKTLEQLLKIAEVDLDLWKVKDYLVNKWDVTSWKSGFPKTVENFQVKARLDRNNDVAKERILGEVFRKMVNNYKAPPITIVKSKYKGTSTPEENNLFEIALFDLHMGKLAWGGETGENYDVKIARKRFLDTIGNLIKRASGFDYSKIFFPTGSDFFNSDTIFNTTTKGTQQDEDLRWKKTFRVGCRLLIDAIELMKLTGVPIDIMIVPGNHDFERSYYMGEYLSAWYKNDPVVKVNNGASPRKYYRFGKVLLGITHGTEEKLDSLPMLMATDYESKPHWTETKFHEWHIGHIHRKRNWKYVARDKMKLVDEDLGITIRHLSSLTGTEEWHHQKGFVGQLKAGEGFIWNDEMGMVAHLNANYIINDK